MSTVADAWDLFSATCMPVTASPVQRQEMRRAFYAGISALMDMLFALDDDEERFIAEMTSIQDELLDFARRVSAGKA